MTNQASGRKSLKLRLRRLYRFVRQDLPAFTLLKPGNIDVAGHILTMHQAGTHWLNNLLAAALIREYGLPELRHIRDRSIILSPRHKPVYPHIPRIIQSHEVPSPLVHARPMQRVLRFPKYAFLVRDIRAAKVSAFEKKQHLACGQVPFSEFLRNDRLIGNPVPRDLWLRIRQLNAWDRDMRRLPADRVLVVHYEDMKRDPARELSRVWSFFDLPDRDPEFFAAAVQATTKERMASREAPGEQSKIVRRSARHPFEWFSPADREFFTHTVDAWLRNDFGYDYHDWTIPEQRSSVAA